MGFDATLRDSYHAVVIPVEGMTCHSCVVTITETLAGKGGIRNVDVSLERKSARILFDCDSLWTPASLCDAVEEMGFQSSLPLPRSSGGGTAVVGVKGKAVVGVKGMTCHSCVATIQETLGGKRGIHSVSVSLPAEQATVVFDPNLWTPQAVAEAIDDMGFQASAQGTSLDADAPTQKGTSRVRGAKKCDRSVSCMSVAGTNGELPEVLIEEPGKRPAPLFSPSPLKGAARK